jgi:hypothetical protein
MKDKRDFRDDCAEAVLFVWFRFNGFGFAKEYPIFV